MEIIDSWDKYFFKLTNLVAIKSKDNSSKVGSIVVKENRILTTGFNGFCIGVKDKVERYNNKELKYRFIGHAEFNSCIVASRFGICLKNATLFTQSTPCHECAKSIIQSGIRTVKTLAVCNDIWKKYNGHWQDSSEIAITMFLESGVELFESDIFCNDEVLIGGKIYTV